jgi:hypothetical protein
MCASVYSSLLLFTLTTISVSKRAPSACKHSRNARLTFTCNNNCSKEKCNSERKYQILPPRSIPRCLTFVLHGFSHITRYFPNGKRIFFKKKHCGFLVFLLIFQTLQLIQNRYGFRLGSNGIDRALKVD